MAKVNIKIEGVSYQVDEGLTNVATKFLLFVPLITGNVPMVPAVYV